ncbi:MAG TPA: hypothetical protein VF494_02355 [Candidatus Limnocylindrales bacterium]
MKPIERARETLGNEALEAAFDRGRRMSLDEALAIVGDDPAATPASRQPGDQ